MLFASAEVIIGLVLLIVGGEFLVRGAASMAASLKISPLVIGLTVVAFGTSAPELGVSLQAALAGNPDVAVGNVVGSNIINVLLVLGVASLVAPLLVSSQLIRFDVPLMIAASIAMWAFAADGVVSQAEGVALFVSLLFYIAYSIWKSRGESAEVSEEFEEYATSITSKKDLVVQFALFLGGLVSLGVGSNWLVDGAKTIATELGVSDLVIGLTVVAIGTSLPEVVTSIVASLRGQRDIAVGNVVGSNLFNVLCVLGLTASVVPAGVTVGPTAIRFDLPVMVGVAVLCFPIFLTGKLIRRWEGLLFVGYYAAYTIVLVLDATGSSLLVGVSRTLMVALPVSMIPIAISVFRDGESLQNEPAASRTDTASP